MRRMKAGVDDIIDKAPIWCLYIRQDPRLPCTCWSSANSAPSYFCKLCLGTGHKIKIEKIPMRISINARELKNENDVTLLGRVEQAAVRGYTTAETFPKDNDLIVSVMWNKSGRDAHALPTAVLRVFSIQIAFPIMQEEITYFSMGLNPYYANLPEFIDGLKQHPLNIGKY